MKDKFRMCVNLLNTNKKVVIIIWFIPVLFVLFNRLFTGCVENNYLIFKNVYFHAINSINLFGVYPDLYNDQNYYGPIFSLIIAPFAILPDQIGAFLFFLCIAISLCIAINQLPIEWKLKVLVYLITLKSIYESTRGDQTNPLIAALIIFAFVSINKGKDFWAACFIMLGFFIKLYGIVGLGFFFFSQNKRKLIISLFFWSAVFFILPMFISSPKFIFQTYCDWYHALLEKDMLNANSMRQDISVMGMIRRIFGNKEMPNIIVLIPAICLFMLQYIRTELYNDMSYRLRILASILMFIVLFSSGSELPTYIIAMAGVGIWFITNNRPYSKQIIVLLIFVIIFSDYSNTDILPSSIRHFFKIYALKVFPCFIIWLTLIVQILKMKKSNIVKGISTISITQKK